MKLQCCAKLKLPTGEVYDYKKTYDYSWYNGTEEEAIDSLAFNWEENNYSCDCNKSIFLIEAGLIPEEEGEFPCGDTIKLVSLEIEVVKE